MEDKKSDLTEQVRVATITTSCPICGSTDVVYDRYLHKYICYKCGRYFDQ